MDRLEGPLEMGPRAIPGHHLIIETFLSDLHYPVGGD
jgi:hypothetical protein